MAHLNMVVVCIYLEVCTLLVYIAYMKILQTDNSQLQACDFIGSNSYSASVSAWIKYRTVRGPYICKFVGSLYKLISTETKLPNLEKSCKGLLANCFPLSLTLTLSFLSKPSSPFHFSLPLCFLTSLSSSCLIASSIYQTLISSFAFTFSPSWSFPLSDVNNPTLILDNARWKWSGPAHTVFTCTCTVVR